MLPGKNKILLHVPFGLFPELQACHFVVRLLFLRCPRGHTQLNACRHNAYETSNDSLNSKSNAPWFCPCLEELQFRCYRINKDPMLKVDDILGFRTRAGILIEALKLSDQGKKAMLVGQMLVAVAMVLTVVTLCPWKHMCLRFPTWCVTRVRKPKWDVKIGFDCLLDPKQQSFFLFTGPKRTVKFAPFVGTVRALNIGSLVRNSQVYYGLLQGCRYRCNV